MRVALLSDLHLSMHPMDAPALDADVVVLAGDLHRPAQAMAWARQFAQPTLFVAGNHEFYGSDLVTTMAQLRAHAEGSRVRVLEQQAWVHRGVRFLGCTLWSDYRLYDSAAEREEGLAKVVRFTRDFSHIALAPDFPALLTPAVSQLLCARSVDWLTQQLATPFDGPTVVVTHFAPARASIAPQFQGSPLNAAFICDLAPLIERWQPALWLHGHVHDSFDYRLGATRVVANPRGYWRGGVAENPRFDPALILEV